jgi:hypothetical protein
MRVGRHLGRGNGDRPSPRELAAVSQHPAGCLIQWEAGVSPGLAVEPVKQLADGVMVSGGVLAQIEGRQPES